MFSATSFSLTVLFLSATVLGQSATPATQTFHVRGTITDQSGAVIPKAKVVFQSTQSDKTVTTNERGVYEADLPFGTYTMTAQVVGFKPYRRPFFRVVSTQTIAFDFTLPVQPTCDLQVVRTDGGTATPEDWEAAWKEFCFREDSFSVPSSDGVPFQVWIRYVKHAVSGDRYSYTGEKAPNDDPVFVAYNLFSLRADEVTYDAKNRTIRAIGNVVAMDEAGITQRTNTMHVRFENGQATDFRQLKDETVENRVGFAGPRARQGLPAFRCSP
jgi:Carboxypeptidase regulatory-like domain